MQSAISPSRLLPLPTRNPISGAVDGAIDNCCGEQSAAGSPCASSVVAAQVHSDYY